MLERDPKRLEPERRLRRPALQVDEPHAFRGQFELTPHSADGPVGRGRPHGPLHGFEAADHSARPQEVFPHEGFDPVVRMRARAAERLGDLLLQFVRQVIDVAATVQMEDGPDPENEVFRFVQPSRRDAIFARGGGLQAPEVPDGYDVAESARRTLDIRFELIEGVVELLMALGHEGKQRVQCAAHVPRIERLRSQAIEHQVVGRDLPEIEQREQEFRVRDVGIAEIRELAHVVSERQLEIPQRLQHRPDEPLFGRTDRSAEDDQQIDIRVQAKRLAAVPAERTDGHRGRGERAGLLDHQLHHTVHAPGVLRGGGAARPPAPRLPGIVLPSRRQHGGRGVPAILIASRRRPGHGRVRRRVPRD